MEIEKLETTIQELEKLVHSVQEFKNERDLHNVWISIFDKLRKLEIKDAEQICFNSNFYADIVTSVFRNKIFNENLLELLKAEDLFIQSGQSRSLGVQKFRESLAGVGVKNKKHIHAALLVAFCPIMMMLPILNRKNILFLKRVILSNFIYIQKFQEWKFSIERIMNVLEDSIFRTRFDTERFSLLNKDKTYEEYRSRNRFIASIMILESAKLVSLADLFKRIDEEKTTKGISVFRLQRIDNHIGNYRSKISNVTKGLFNLYCETDKRQYDNLVENITDKNGDNILEFILTFSKCYKYTDKETSILKGLSYATKRLEELSNAGKLRLSAFLGNVSEDDAEWSNKVYLTCQKTLGVFMGIKDAQDTKWKMKVFNRELSNWFNETHSILNKFEIEDDWSEIEKFVSEENDEIEWKASFITPLEIDPLTPLTKLPELGKTILEENLVKTMIAMMNTQGGNIIVGFVEHPDKVKRENFKNNLVYKNGLCFFDIGFDLAFNNTNLDGLKLLIQDKFKKLTNLPEDHFNNLWSLKQLSIKKNNKVIEIYKITINKSSRPIFHVNSSWVTLARRANARTIFKDPRSYLKDAGA